MYASDFLGGVRTRTAPYREGAVRTLAYAPCTGVLGRTEGVRPYNRPSSRTTDFTDVTDGTKGKESHAP
jgi:hypothetical protein